MKPGRITRIIVFILLLGGCTIEFTPEIDDAKELLVVSGLITDQDVSNKITLSRSVPVGKPLTAVAVSGALVSIADETGTVYFLAETSPGTYSTDSTLFRGRVGGSYSLNIRLGENNYETDFIKMKPVPPINSLYHEKVVINASRDSLEITEGCRIFLDSYDPAGECLFFRWSFVETWEYYLPFPSDVFRCWATEPSERILVRNTSVYSQARISRFPVVFITNRTKRLNVNYSILVNQYSIDESEYYFWERVQNISENVGGLYDMTPMAIQGNIRSVTDPGETVLGYFSVSAVSRKRLFVRDRFLGLSYFYPGCTVDTIYGVLPQGVERKDYWIVEDNANEIPSWWVITRERECADCKTDADRIKPDFWEDFL